MKGLDWQMILFVGASMMQEAWILWGLPKMYYWNITNENKKDDDNHNNAA